jgi:hypothetical protein
MVNLAAVLFCAANSIFVANAFYASTPFSFGLRSSSHLVHAHHSRLSKGAISFKCSTEHELQVGVSDDVQNVGRGTLLSQKDAVKEVSVKVKGLYDAYPYPPEAVFDGPTVGYNHRFYSHISTRRFLTDCHLKMQ